MTWDRWVEVVVTVISAVAAVLVRVQWQASQFRVPEHGDDERPGDVLRLRQPEDDGPLEAFVINPFGEDGYDDDG